MARERERAEELPMGHMPGEGDAPSVEAEPSFEPDATARGRRRAWRDRLNAKADRRFVIGVIATLVGGSFWGLSGTSAGYLFDVCHVDTAWLMSVRQIFAGLLFLLWILATERKKLVQILTTPTDRRELIVFAFAGLLLNQFCYLWAVRLTNAGTATVMQCLQLVIIMAYSCIAGRRAPRKRELAGIVLAFAGTFLIATGGDPSSLSIPAIGLVFGLLTAFGAALMTIFPRHILPKYGSSVVTGTAMLMAGIVSSAFVRPWENPPVLDATGLEALAVLVVIGSFLAYFLYMYGVKEIGSMRAGLIGTVEPMSATITSALVLGTVFSGTDLAGFALIIIMVFLTV